MQKHYFNHGVGINRWQSYGTYGTQANLAGFPSAGAQSGTTADVMLALQLLGENDVYSHASREAVKAMTLVTAAFMNFGGYHTMAEVYPIGMSVVRNDVFSPTDVASKLGYNPIYESMLAWFKQCDASSEVVARLTDLITMHNAAVFKYRNPAMWESKRRGSI